MSGMKIAVIGAGVVGVSTAYELADDGHEVTVFERNGSVASETSFANAGLVAPGYVAPWAAPGMAWRLLRQLWRQHAPARLGGRLNAATAAWLWQWWRAGQPASHAANRARMHRLALYSQERLRALRQQLQLDYERADGVLVLLREPRELEAMRGSLALLDEQGTSYRMLDAAQCLAVEPGLNPETGLHAGLHLAGDEVGNCRQFTHQLRLQAQRLGVRFRFHTTVRRIDAGARPQLLHEYTPAEAATGGRDGRTPLPTPTDTDWPETQPMERQSQLEAFDAVVVCAAMGSAALLRPLGLKLPLAPVYGYSITAPLRQLEAYPDLGPRAALMDERYKVAISRIGQRVRVAGAAELGGSAGQMDPRALATLHRVLNDWFPGAAQLGQIQQWKGARPMLPDGPPLLGSAGMAGVWLNLGHGSSGWALAAGSARVLADQIGGRPAAIDCEGLGRDRLR